MKRDNNKGLVKEIVTLSKDNILTIRTLSKDDKEIKKEDFPFKEVSEEELYAYRKTGKPAMCLKKEGKYYYTEIPKDLKMLSRNILGDHCCGRSGGADCGRLYACKECGCRKVMDLGQDSYEKLYYSKNQALYLSKRIEKYDFITLGYETFNTQMDVFVVVKCTDYTSEEKGYRQKRSAEEVNRLKIGLAQYFWPDVSTRSEVQRRVRNNHMMH